MSLLLISQTYAASDASSDDDDSELTASACGTSVLNSSNNKNKISSSSPPQKKLEAASQKVRTRKSKTVTNTFKAKPVRYSSDGARGRLQTKSKRSKKSRNGGSNGIFLTSLAIQSSKSKDLKDVAILPNNQSKAQCLEEADVLPTSSIMSLQDDHKVFGNGFLHRPTFRDLVNSTEETLPLSQLPSKGCTKTCSNLNGLQKHENGVSKLPSAPLSLSETKPFRNRKYLATKKAGTEDDRRMINAKPNTNCRILNDVEKLRHPNLKTAIIKLERCDNLMLRKKTQQRKTKTMKIETTTKNQFRKSLECSDGKPFKFEQKKYFREHQHITHTDERPYKCMICDKSFARRDRWLAHQRVHSGEKPFKCVTCAKLFAEKKTLVNHQRTHTGEKPFKCLTCTNSFSQWATLLYHQRIHTGEKPFKCMTCAKSFAGKSTLVNHQRTHSGEKPFRCLTCAKSFAQRATLLQHHRTHTPGKC